MKILVLNGPNMNLLGLRQPDIYGKTTYEELVQMISAEAKKRNIEAEFFQSNHEGDLVDAIQNAYGRINGIVINPAAYTHTSIAIPDAINAVALPTVEVHISDPDIREDFRRISYVRKVCVATVKGKGIGGYIEALDILLAYHEKQIMQNKPDC